MPDAVIGKSLRDEVEDQIPNEKKWLEFRSYTYSDIPSVLYGDEKGNNTPEEWAEYRAKKIKENYCGKKKEDIGIDVKTEENMVYILRNRNQRTYHDVLKGKVKTNSGLKVSENQFYGKVPKYTNKYGNYHSGLVVKISGDYDSLLKSHHNKIGIISEVIDDYHFVVRTKSSETIKVRDTDVKSWIYSKETGECFTQNSICNKISQEL
jgi:hypothetical protein